MKVTITILLLLFSLLVFAQTTQEKQLKNTWMEFTNYVEQEDWDNLLPMLADTVRCPECGLNTPQEKKLVSFC